MKKHVAKARCAGGYMSLDYDFGVSLAWLRGYSEL